MAWITPISTNSDIPIGAGDDLFVGSNVTVATNNNNPTAYAAGGGHDFLVYGTMSNTDFEVIHLGNLGASSGNSLRVKPGGHLQTFNGVNTVVLDSVASEIFNEGLISSLGGSAIFLTGISAGDLTVITNRGTIEGYIAIGRHNTQVETIVLNNAGTINGTQSAYDIFVGAPANIDTVTNIGTMIGDINLLGGADSYSGTKGRLVGRVLGGDDSDTILGGKDPDRFFGENGSDTLNGGLGRDTLNGGDGGDRFVFSAISHSPNSSARDIIEDFDDANTADRIDFSALFGSRMTYIHKAAFTGLGQVRINDVPGANVIVEVNTRGSLAPDFSVLLKMTSAASMNAGDFIL